jgi:ubiquinone/menaquinone biosynthesis C-methylase UbiE
LSDWNPPVAAWREALQRAGARQKEQFNKTLSDRTRRVYDRVATIYPASTFFFHKKAHKLAIEMAKIENGDRVLEIATGSGEMFKRLLRANPGGVTIGLDLSPNMAAVTQARVRKEFPRHRAALQSVDARNMPFLDHTFDNIVCCYLWELLGTEDIVSSLAEVERVLKPGGRFTTILIGQNLGYFNQMYKVATRVAPAFWGRQVSEWVPEEIESLGFAIEYDQHIRQGYYPSRVVVARKP